MRDRVWVLMRRGRGHRCVGVFSSREAMDAYRETLMRREAAPRRDFYHLWFVLDEPETTTTEV